MKHKVLFVCVQNSARSQMAEALLQKHCGEFFEVQSAGMKPGALNPLAVEVMSEIGLDISGNRCKDIFPFIRQRPVFNYVIAVCDQSAGQHCPSFPQTTTQLQWSFPDPAQFTGTPEEKLERTRELRDAIAARILAWCEEVCRTELIA